MRPGSKADQRIEEVERRATPTYKTWKQGFPTRPGSKGGQQDRATKATRETGKQGRQVDRGEGLEGVVN